MIGLKVNFLLCLFDGFCIHYIRQMTYVALKYRIERILSFARANTLNICVWEFSMMLRKMKMKNKKKKQFFTSGSISGMIFDVSMDAFLNKSGFQWH